MNRKELVAKLELVGRALANNNRIPIFTHFVFNEGSVYCYEDNLGLVSPCDVELEPFAVHGTTFLGLLKNTTAEEIDLKLKDDVLYIKAGKSTFKLPILNKSAFLFEAPALPSHVIVSIDEDLCLGLQACLGTVGNDQAAPGLIGVSLSLAQNPRVLYSCDGDALSSFVLDADIKKEKEASSSYLLPTSFCEAVLKVREEVDASENATLAFDNEWAVAAFTSGDTVYGRMMVNTNPLNHKELFDKTVKTEPIYLPVPDNFDGALSRARVLADSESAPTILSIVKGKLQIVTTTNKGDADDVMPMRGHLDVEAKVNASLIQRSLKICNEIAVMDNCTVMKSGDKYVCLISNMG